jgi:hypothetical protein
MKYKPGQSGNPKGRPKSGTALTDLLRKELNRKDEDNVAKKARLVNKLIELADGGDVIALKYVFDRVDGRPTETVKADVSGAMDFNTAAAAEKLERMVLHDKP